MKSLGLIVIVPFIFALVVLGGCASTKVTDQQIYVMEKVPRPDLIVVYDFAATPADVPAYSSLAGQYGEIHTPQTSDEIATGRRLGARIATQLVERIRGMGLPAAKGSAETRLQINDIVIQGYLVSVEEGSQDARVAIGFRAGVSGLKTAVEGYQMTAQGLRKLASGTVESGGSKTPGAAVPLAVMLATDNPVGLIVSGTMKIGGELSGKSKIEGRADQTAKEIAQRLKKRFEQLGWIK